MPGGSLEAETMNGRTRNRVWKWSLVGLFGAAALAIAAGGCWLYRRETQAARREKQSELKAIAELKAGQIAAWRDERLADARVNSKSAGLRAAVGHWPQASGDASWKKAIYEPMELLRASCGYANVILAGTDGRIRLSLDPQLTVLDAGTRKLVAQAISSREAVFGDLFRCPTCHRIHLDVASPILDRDQRPAAVLILRSDPQRFLYPLIQSWPTPSRSAETLLVRRDGDDVLFLNKLRHRSDPAMTLRIPLSRTDVPAVRAACGKTGAFESRDNRGVEVLAEVLRVPNSPWFMVAKVDADEILAEARYRGRFILLFTALCILVTGALAALVFSFRQNALFQTLYRAERGQRQAEQMLRDNEDHVNRLMQGRETRIVGLKREVNALRAELGHGPGYREENEPEFPSAAVRPFTAPDAGGQAHRQQYPVRDLGLEKPGLNVAFIPILCCAPLLYAKSHGYFARNGLEVTLTPAPGWSGVKDLLVFGQIDAAHMLSAMPLAIRQGLDGRRAEIRLACMQNVNGQALTLAKRHAGIGDVREMKGFTFGVPYLLSMHYYLLCLFLAEHGLDPLRDVSIMEISPPRMPHFLETGRIDGVFAPEPVNQISVRRGSGVIYRLSKDIWNGHPCCCFATTETFIAKNPKTYQAMRRSVLEAELALHRASPEQRRDVAAELCQPGILDQSDIEPVAQALSGEYDDGAGRHRIDHDRMDFLPTPWEEYGVWMLSQQQRWKQSCCRVDYREVVDRCFDGTTHEAAKALGFEEPGPNLEGIKTFQFSDPFGGMRSQPFCAFVEQGQTEPPPIPQRIARLSDLLAAAAGGRGLPNIESAADDGFGALERLVGDLFKNMQFANDALHEQKETLERTVEERVAEINQNRRNAISIAEDAEAARQASEASRAQHEQVVAMISDVVWRYEVDGQGRFVTCYISPVADRLLGLPAGTIGNSFDAYFSYIHPEDLPLVREALTCGLKTPGREVAVEYRLCKPGGTILCVGSKGSAYRQLGGHVAAFGTTTDITEHKREEYRSKLDETRANTLLELSQLTDRSVSDIANHALESAIRLTGSTIGYIAFANEDETVLTMHYWSMSAMQQCAMIDKPIVYPVKDTGLWGEAIRQRKAVITNDYAAANPLKKGTPSGHVRLTRHMNIPVFDGGRIVAVAGVGNKAEDYQDDDVRQLTLFMDGMWRILCRKRAEEALEAAIQQANSMAVQAQAATRAKSDFLANMSHEIRTPMTSILGYADLLMDDSLGAADRNAYLTTVRRNGEHLLQLINDILDLSKIESGKMVMDLGPCHLLSTIADVASMMRPRAEQHRTTLEVRYTGPLPRAILTDGERFRQVLVNLVGNAVKFTDNGNIRISVTFLPQWRPDQSAVSVEVEDTGIGIRQESLQRLFQPFTQAESSTTRKHGGTGLGLAISRQIVMALGGELTVRSVPGEGSTFTVTIPTGDVSGANLMESPGEVICEDQNGARWTPGAGVLRGTKILLAEDSIDNQDLLRTVLGKAGADVEVVENGILAVQRATQCAFDVVLMDMNMPEMDGYEATRRLRDGGYRRPILALTANAMSGDSELCLAAGCDLHLAKPIDRKELIETVAHYAMSTSTGTDAPAAGPGGAETSGLGDGISSQFANDPQLAEILPRFIERLPGQLDVLCTALAEERLEDAERLAHRLKGSGGSYGYPTLTEAAKSLEAAAKARDPGEATAALAGVKQICTAIQTGWTSHTRETSQP
jgi:signal transduction histidine kinase/ABC-type nitrate/sulfonate/bicarbonate transport system substrate-binding protein/CheY-like chemotaxis protein/HPt (histidine-containing phosphotransfer) domain-containing protein